jgi:hypothetical protein
MKKKTKPPAPEPTLKAIQAAYAIIGRLNGRKGGEARKAVLSDARRKEIGIAGGEANRVKWIKIRAEKEKRKTS